MDYFNQLDLRKNTIKKGKVKETHTIEKRDYLYLNFKCLLFLKTVNIIFSTTLLTYPVVFH